MKRKEPTGARLLDIATDHVRRHGVERTSVVAVAREAGISHAAIYRYFASRNALIDAITGEWLKLVETQLAGVADAPDPADDKLERMMLLLSRLYRDRLEQDANLFAAWLQAVIENRATIRRHRRRIRALIERVVEEGCTTQIFNAQSSESLILFLADALHRFIDPVAIYYNRAISRSEIDQRLARLLRAAIRALVTGNI